MRRFFLVLLVLLAALSASSTAAFAADTTAPSAPATLTATPGNQRVDLAWSASTDNVGVTGYDVWRRLTSGTTWSQIATTSGTTRTYANTGLVNGTGYTYSVRAKDAAGNASASSPLAATTVGAPPVAPPTAAFTFSPANPQTGQQVTFDASGSTCAAAPCTYTWIDDLSDGSGGSSASLGVTQSTTFTFTFQTAATKYVRLTVTDAQSRPATVEHDVVVTAAPAPTPTPTPTPTAAPPIWKGDASQPIYNEWASFVEAGSAGTVTSSTNASTQTPLGRISQVDFAGRRAYKATVLAGDRDRYTTTAQRTEVGQQNPGKTFPDGVDRHMYEGQERWIAGQIYIPASAPLGYAFQVLTQLKGNSSGSPMVEIDFLNGSLTLDKIANQMYGTTNTTRLFTTPVVKRDTWLKVMIHVKWSMTSSGILELYGNLSDGQGYRRLFTYNGWTNGTGETGGPNIIGQRIGLYRYAVAQDTTIYHSGWNTSDNEASAYAAAGF